MPKFIIASTYEQTVYSIVTAINETDAHQELGRNSGSVIGFVVPTDEPSNVRVDSGPFDTIDEAIASLPELQPF